MGVMEDSKKKKVMEHREEVRYEVSNQFQLSKSDPLVGCNSRSGIGKIIGCNTIVNTESSRHGAHRESWR